ncbi:MAG TPA: hypothetical protein V6C96_02075, partial [Vampirovibrionales bacterium]
AFTGESLETSNKQLFEAINNETDLNLLNMNLKKFQAFGSVNKAASFDQEAKSPEIGEEAALKDLDTQAAAKIKRQGGIK